MVKHDKIIKCPTLRRSAKECSFGVALFYLLTQFISCERQVTSLTANKKRRFGGVSPRAYHPKTDFSEGVIFMCWSSNATLLIKSSEYDTDYT